ncbi:hypothetical protein EV426DRAFT_68932 [Tirmania nivea]|nr:hypothetical protein EV426DRAFT_68932 [Tirmania nivea]
MPVETRAQIRAREEAAKGPASRAGARAASSRATTHSSTSGVEVPPSPAAKKAVAAKKASAAAAKKRSTAGKGPKKTAARKKKSPFDTFAKDFSATLPPGEIEGLNSIVVKPVTKDSYSKRKDQPTIETILTTEHPKTKTTNTQETSEPQATEIDPDVTYSEDEENGGIELAAPNVISNSWVDPYADLSPAERAETISRYVCYRTGYSHTPEDWEGYKKIIMEKFKAQEMKLGKEESSLEIIWVENEARFGGNNIPEVRKAFNLWISERNSHAPNPATDPFSEGPYQDFTTNICLVADSTSITSVLAFANSSPGAIPPTIVVVDRHYCPAAHTQEVIEAGDEVQGADWDVPGDPREADADIVERGDKVIWEGYKGFFRAGVDEWMNVESEAQPERDLPSFWMQYFAKYAEGRFGGWELARCGVLE